MLGGLELPPAGDKLVAHWGPATDARRLEVAKAVVIKPVHAGARISNQKGFFTIHGADHAALDRLARRSANGDHGLVKLLSPASSVAVLRSDLTVAGITETSILQELDGLSRELRQWFLGA